MSDAQTVDSVLRDYEHDLATYAKVSDILDAEMTKGLSRNDNRDATVKMLITYVRNLPTGKERGRFLALDLGGTNFRVLLITVTENHEVDMKNTIFAISNELMTGSGAKLFDFLAECIAKFVAEHGLSDRLLQLGFTFSFPCKQEGLAVGRLIHWSKNFKCSGVEGKDVVRLLQQAICRRKDLKVHCIALINDTVGCLMSCAFHDQETSIGVIIGTGTNACYVEKLDNVELWDGDDQPPRQVIINTEWGAFGDDGCLDFMRTPIDREIDNVSINPDQHKFEKMISGMYLGEIVRLIIMRCADANLLFNGHTSVELQTPGRFYTKYISEIETDDESVKATKQVLDELGMTSVSLTDLQHVRRICHVLSHRAACLVAAGIATLVRRVDQPSVTVGMDGSFYRFHPEFQRILMKTINDLLDNKYKVTLKLSEDGSGIGAALVAAAAHYSRKSATKK